MHLDGHKVFYILSLRMCFTKLVSFTLPFKGVPACCSGAENQHQPNGIFGTACNRL